MSKALKIFGFLYFVTNIIICFLIAMFATSAWMAGNFSTGYIIIVLPLTGILSGYWMRKSLYGLWRSLIIGSNIIVTIAILFTAIFISPGLEKAKQKKFESNRISEQHSPNEVPDK
ncbi:MAG: hypothetical protein HUN04_05930 [Desulfobacter sp.]|nr:MAG: hypothetical protein HUN04_05930 [Desulfobacter sp.]